MKELSDLLGDLLSDSFKSHRVPCTCDKCSENLQELIKKVRAKGEEPSVDSIMKANREDVLGDVEKRMSIEIEFGIRDLNGMLLADLESIIALCKKYKYQIACDNSGVKFFPQKIYDKKVAKEKKVFSEALMEIMKKMNKKGKNDE